MLAGLRLMRPSPLGISLGCSVAAGYSILASSRMRPLRADAPRAGQSDSSRAIHDAARSSARKSGLDLRIMRQISSGSIAGLVGGVALSVFSKPLTLLIGILMLGVQYLESRGLHVVPWQRMQRYASGINIRTALQDNVAFKLSFSAMFTLAAFAEF